MDKDKIIDAVVKAKDAAKSEFEFEVFKFLKVSNFGVSDKTVSDEGKKAIADLAKATIEANATLLADALSELLADK